jgi:hypothetical protein
MNLATNRLHENLVVLSGRTGKIFTKIGLEQYITTLYVETETPSKNTNKIQIRIDGSCVSWMKKYLKLEQLNQSLFLSLKGQLETYDDPKTNQTVMFVRVTNVMSAAILTPR